MTIITYNKNEIIINNDSVGIRDYIKYSTMNDYINILTFHHFNESSFNSRWKYYYV